MTSTLSSPRVPVLFINCSLIAYVFTNAFGGSHGDAARASRPVTFFFAGKCSSLSLRTGRSRLIHDWTKKIGAVFRADRNRGIRNYADDMP